METPIYSTVTIKNTIKKMLGVEANYTAFDTDLLFFINSAIMELSQLGVCSPNFQITENGNETWDSLLSDFSNEYLLNSAQNYIYIKTRLIFDPPNSGYVTSALQKELDEITWRLRVQMDGESDEW